MKTILPVALLTFGGLLSTLPLAAQTTNAAPAATTPPATASTPAPLAGAKPKGQPIFKAPNFGAPQTRVGGGSRGVNGTNVSLQVLVPEQIALTTQAMPSLYWYQSAPAEAHLEVTLVEPHQPKPLLSLKAPSAMSTAGIHRLNLAQHKLSLKPGVTYRWTVALVTDEKNRSSDLIATGAIQRVEPGKDWGAKLLNASPAEKVEIYAQEGIWYDALQLLSELITANPNEPAFRDQRAQLLEQIKLPEAAAADKTAAK